MPVTFDDMIRELFTPKDCAAIRRTAARIAKRHMALLEMRQERNRPIARRLGVKRTGKAT